MWQLLTIGDSAWHRWLNFQVFGLYLINLGNPEDLGNDDRGYWLLLAAPYLQYIGYVGFCQYPMPSSAGFEKIRI